MRQWVSRTLVALMLVPGMGTFVLVDSAVADCTVEKTQVSSVESEGLQYKVEQKCPEGTPPSDTHGSGPAAPGPAAPGCDLTSPATFCFGPYACYYTDDQVSYPASSTPPPSPGAVWRVRLCLVAGGSSALWLGTGLWVPQAAAPPTLVERSQAAFGRLVAPDATLAFNPTRRTLVNLDTWFWAQDLPGQPIRGTAALGLVAVATPAGIQVNPGDGSGSFSCPWVTSRSPQCSHVYRRSSVGGSSRGLDGGLAYQASAVATWSVHFELNGTPVPIPGATTKLTSRMAAAVEVAEVQTIVTWSR
jgi:hypothetical protein